MRRNYLDTVPRPLATRSLTSFRPFLVIAALAFLVCSSNLVRAEEMSAYDSWAKYKPGSSVTLKRDLGYSEGPVTYIYTLLKITPETVVVKIDVKNGPPYDKPTEYRKGDIERTLIPPDAKITEETLAISGKKFKCKLVETNFPSNKKTWTSTEMPGILVKQVTISEDKKKTYTEEIVEVKLK